MYVLRHKLCTFLFVAGGNIVSVGVVDPTVMSGEEIVWDMNQPLVWEGNLELFHFGVIKIWTHTVKCMLCTSSRTSVHASLCQQFNV